MAEPILPQSSDSATVTLPPDLTQLGRDLYAELRRRWVAGGRRPFLAPHRELAELLGCSASTAGDHMQFLDDAGLIHRAPYKNKYLITIFDGPSVFDPVGDHTLITDRSAVIGPAAAVPAVSAAHDDLASGREEPELRSPIDRNLHNGTHDSLMQQQQQPRASADYWVGREGDHQALRAELAGEDDAELVAKLFRRNPTLTLTEFAREVANAATRPNVYCPPALALKVLAAGERVTPARASPPPGPTGDPPTERARRPKDRWADDRPTALSAAWAEWQAEQEARDRRLARSEVPYAATT